MIASSSSIAVVVQPLDASLGVGFEACQGISVRWHLGQFVCIACPRGLAACGAINDAAVTGAVTIADGTPADPLVYPADLLRAKIHRMSSAASALGVEIGMTGREVLLRFIPEEVSSGIESCSATVTEIGDSRGLLVRWDTAHCFTVVVCEFGLVGTDGISAEMLEHFKFAVAIVETDGEFGSAEDLLRGRVVKVTTEASSRFSIELGMSGDEAVQRLSLSKE